MAEKRRLRTYSVSSGRTVRCRETRPSAAKRGYDKTWRRLRLQHLRQQPLCVECKKIGKLTAGEEVDHVIPHRGDRQLLLDPENLQTLCKSHHSQKTARGE